MRLKAALNVLRIGAVGVVLAAATYKAFDLDRYFVPKELVLHFCATLAALFCLRGRRRLTVGVVDLLLVAFLIASVAAALLACNHWAAERALAISLSGAALFWSAAALRREGLVRPLLVALAVAVVVGAATSLAQAYGVQTEFFSLNRAPGGTFGNRNFVAHLCTIGTPVVVLVALTAKRGFGSLFGGIAMAIVAAALVLSRSRAAWLAVIALAVPVGALGWMTWNRWCEPRTVRRALVLGASVVAGVIAAVVLPNHLEWKSDSPFLDSAAGLVNYREGSGRGRLVQYGNSVRMTATDPVLGVGPGNWPVVYPKYASRNDPSMSQESGVTSNPWPSSDWVAYLSERGAVGVGLLLLVMLGLAWRALRDLRAGGRDAERTLTAIALIGTLVATAVVGAFDAVLLVAVPTFFVWTLAGALAPPPTGGETIETGVRALVPMVALLGLVAVGRAALQVAAMSVYSGSTRVAAADRAAALDPGSYRILTRAAALHLARGDCAHARPPAHAAHALYPNAAEPRRQIADCGGR
ncbi:MAG: O-antigen ligase family protein [Gemmatimonadales bacterium]